MMIIRGKYNSWKSKSKNGSLQEQECLYAYLDAKHTTESDYETYSEKVNFLIGFAAELKQTNNIESVVEVLNALEDTEKDKNLYRQVSMFIEQNILNKN